MSHETVETPRGLGASVAGIKDHYKTLTGSEPPTCPWRVFYDPLVSAVVGAVTAAREQLAVSVLGGDPPAILIDGIRVYLAARNATQAHDHEQEKKRRENDPRRKK